MTNVAGRVPHEPPAKSARTTALERGLRLIRWPGALVIAGLLVADGILIAIHWTLRNDRIPLFDVERAGSLPAVLQWLQLLAAAALLIAAYRSARRRAYAASAAIVGLTALDDAGELHERGGLWVSDVLSLPALGDLAADDVGELVVGGALALVIAALFVWGWLRSTRSDRLLLLLVMAAVASLGLLAFVIDAIHASMQDETLRRVFLGTVEDGGELVVSTLLLAVVWRFLYEQRRDGLSYTAHTPVR